MLQILIGLDRVSCSNELIQRMTDAASREVAGQILIVPEQYSHDSERKLCLRGGDCISRYAEVLSFSRLAVRAFSQYGGAGRKTLDRGGRFVSMALSLEQIQSRLKIYGACGSKPEFLTQLIALIEEFKNYGVTPEDLAVAEAEQSGAFAQKLEELSLMMEAYDAVCANSGADPSDTLRRLSSLLWETEFFEGKTFYVDGFTDFTGLQEDVLESLIAQDANVTISFVCDDVLNGQQLFDAARNNVRHFMGLAARHGVKADVQQLPMGDEHPERRHLRAYLFSSETAAYEGEALWLSMYHCGSLYEECLLAASQVQSLCAAGYRRRDIGIACGDYGTYETILRGVFRRFSLPAYWSGTEEILSQPMIQAILSALRAAVSGMEFEDVFSYLKSSIAPIDREISDELEQYVKTWDIRGTAWERAFTMHPDGYGQSVTPETQARLSQLNVWRQEAVGSLLRLKNDLGKAENTETQIRAFAAFLEEIQVAERLQALSETADRQTAQKELQLYDILRSAMEQMNSALGKSVHTKEAFYTLFKLLLTQYRVGTIPASLDSVLVGSVSDLCVTERKVLLVLGADLLPAFQKETGLLSEEERAELQRCGLRLSPDSVTCMERELQKLYRLLTMPEDRLVLLGSQDTPSFFMKRLRLLFPKLTVQKLPEFPRALFSDRKHAGVQLAMARRLGDDALSAVLSDLNDPELLACAEKLERQASYDLGELDETGVASLYGTKLRLSASKIDVFASCRLEYFLKYGLRLEQWKTAAMDAPVFGTFLHAVLEQTTRQILEEGGFSVVPEERALDLCEENMKQQAQLQIGALSDHDERFQYLYLRNQTEIREVLKDLCREMKNSSFVPAAFELGFGTGGDMPAVVVQTTRGDGVITGFVDRVDLYREGDKTYVRVVDYKTGKKVFRYSDVLNGMELQMLIYLFALQDHGEHFAGGKLTPAGVLYFPARNPILPVSGWISGEEAEAKRVKERKRTGLIADEEPVLQAMEHCDGAPVYLPYTVDKAGNRKGDLFDGDQLKNLKFHVQHQIASMTEEILEGRIAPNPYEQNGSPCDYCSYRTVCHLDSAEISKRRLGSVKAEDFWARLEKEAEDHG